MPKKKTAEQVPVIAREGPSQIRVLGIVLAGGKGSRLFPLTRERAKPAVPFGGKYRLSISFLVISSTPESTPST